ncbi:hypothetical protein NBRC10512_003040 [Rhodotorula toruloides]|uniref:RHTO0S17e01552g1_1 n=2 Tax=Rhodotorula toruloides TaxID=5286 RepID=A0A061BED0_RHOTO|nr:uncharacterized protein RHTO_03367 [Rhodotorula toruloides NP11]EMS20448.1 hypothetical protein RHTO_03367 [Rhodotorula toruloides NP11]KAJ8291908.1 hypothetical protein OF846_004696 [Rhodotorula toruloides]CDR48341.1 RHTO0S17e01552g1_1 [Rhodotorula toruloides]
MFATRSSRRFYAVAITLTVPSCVAIGYYLRDTTDSSNALISASPTLTATGPPTEPVRLKPGERAQLVKERFAVEERLGKLRGKERELDAEMDELARRLERVKEREREKEMGATEGR